MTEYRAPLRSDRESLTVVSATPASGHGTVLVAGRLDAVSAPDLRAEVDRLAEAGYVTLIIDLSDVRFLDSAGLAALVRARRECRAQGGDVVLISPRTDAALRVFRLTQFDQIFRLVPAREAALP